MAEKRKYQRFDTNQDVYLYHGVSKYSGRLENISCNGALVEIATMPQLMEPGDICHLAFVSNPDDILCSCTVIRMLPSSVGVQFFDVIATA